MPRRRVDVFFYGLFMDADTLREKGLDPQGAELASVHGYALRIGQRAMLVADHTAVVHGVVMSLMSREVDELYAEPSVSEYKPVNVIAHLKCGGTLTAACYTLPVATGVAEHNADYVTKLQAVGYKVGLPPSYIESIR